MKIRSRVQPDRPDPPGCSVNFRGDSAQLVVVRRLAAGAYRGRRFGDYAGGGVQEAVSASGLGGNKAGLSPVIVQFLTQVSDVPVHDVAARHVPRPPFVQFRAPLVWTTLKLTIAADGSSQFEVVGASVFPRHWVYDNEGKLAAKVGLADFKQWYRRSFGRNTPWGATNSAALVTAVETALERELSGLIMRGGEAPKIRKLKPGALLTEQGQAGDEVFLVLDGVLTVEVDGAPLAELGPGAILGERAVLEGGTRTSTLRAATKCRVAAVRGDQLDRTVLEQISQGHRREEASHGMGETGRA